MPRGSRDLTTQRGEEEENGAKKKPSGPDSAAPPNPK